MKHIKVNSLYQTNGGATLDSNSFVTSRGNLSDISTKALSRKNFSIFCNKLCDWHL